jgi:hypothetical protein
LFLRRDGAIPLARLEPRLIRESSWIAFRNRKYFRTNCPSRAWVLRLKLLNYLAPPPWCVSSVSQSAPALSRNSVSCPAVNIADATDDARRVTWWRRQVPSFANCARRVARTPAQSVSGAYGACEDHRPSKAPRRCGHNTRACLHRSRGRTCPRCATRLSHCKASRIARSMRPYPFGMAAMCIKCCHHDNTYDL